MFWEMFCKHKFKLPTTYFIRSGTIYAPTLLFLLWSGIHVSQNVCANSMFLVEYINIISSASCSVLDYEALTQTRDKMSIYVRFSYDETTN
jgi:hypothetical protein